MRVLLLSKALVNGPYQTKCEELAAIAGIELTVAVPYSWQEPRVGTLTLERRHTQGYRLEALPITFNGHHHLHYYPTLGQLVKNIKPHVFHIDEESFNLATFLAMRSGIRHGARCCFYNYANIDRYYPPPFSIFEQYSFDHATHALAANREAAAIIHRHGYQGPLTILPQFGVDPQQFAPAETPAPRDRPVIGYIGRLVPEKGISDLLAAYALLKTPANLRIIGEGTYKETLAQRAHTLGIAERVEWQGWTNDTAAALRELDLLVLPSHTTRSWKEQFGRILIEAMSSGVVVVGSDSGEIPHVIGDAGVVVPEHNPAALATQLEALLGNPARRAILAARGRARVLAEFTQAALARRYAEIYREMLDDTRMVG